MRIKVLVLFNLQNDQKIQLLLWWWWWWQRRRRREPLSRRFVRFSAKVNYNHKSYEYIRDFLRISLRTVRTRVVKHRLRNRLIIISMLTVSAKPRACVRVHILWNLSQTCSRLLARAHAKTARDDEFKRAANTSARKHFAGGKAADQVCQL